jgi:gas vesicle protein
VTSESSGKAGALAGVGLYLWAKGRAREAREAMPEAGRDIARQAQETVRDVAERLRDAVREGREAMSEREDELRRHLLK